jgi:hypothetical protein
MLVALGQNRYSNAIDEVTGTQIVQGLNVRVAEGTLPGTHHLKVLADIITIEGAALSFPGKDLTLVARIIRGNATISTKGAPGTPSFTNETQPVPGQPGLAADIGQQGGSVTIVATVIDTGGGKGGDAQNGAKGLQGAPGVPGSYMVRPTVSGNGVGAAGSAPPGARLLRRARALRDTDVARMVPSCQVVRSITVG